MRNALLLVPAFLFSIHAPQNAFAQESRAGIEAIVSDYLAAHPDEVGAIVKDYFIKHPEAVGQILAELMKHRSSTPSAASLGTKTGADLAAIRGNAAELFASPHQVTLGNPQGDVTLVEFFDYNCGFCRHALADTLALLHGDPQLKVVLKEFPILGPGSTQAARVAIAARMQDSARYLAFHQELLGSAGPVTEEKALDAAKDQGFDMARLERDMTSDEVAATIAENMRLASALGVSGTPSYVIGSGVIMGAVGADALKARIKSERGTVRSVQ
ncbi:MAG: DsbA family protein [Hyphomicrobiales bacterium]|nr:DsbA family protein [Hyphomicrobiales bacterium]MBV9433706.1 DsbA family protein [Hyphomicrobiales bacterium]